VKDERDVSPAALGQLGGSGGATREGFASVATGDVPLARHGRFGNRPSGLNERENKWEIFAHFRAWSSLSFG
jgi:hypothetical protein